MTVYELLRRYSLEDKKVVKIPLPTKTMDTHPTNETYDLIDVFTKDLSRMVREIIGVPLEYHGGIDASEYVPSATEYRERQIERAKERGLTI